MLATAGLVCGQQAPPLPASAPGAEEKTITVQEPGKAPQKCKVVRAWQTAAGAMAYQVKALDTGETMTIEESGPAAPAVAPPPGSHMKALATRIFHWGSNNTPPEGTPMPPPDTAQYARPEASHLQLTSDAPLPVVVNQPVPLPPPPDLPVIVSGSDGAPTGMPTPTGSSSLGSKVVGNRGGPQMAQAWPPVLSDHAGTPAPATVVPVAAPAAAPPAAAPATPMPAVATPAGQPGRISPVPAVAGAVPAAPPCPSCCECQCQGAVTTTVVDGPVIIDSSAPRASGLLPRLSNLVKRQSSPAAEAGTVVVTTPPPANPADPGGKPAYLADSSLPPKPAKPAVEPAKPGDWRQSWGQLDKPDTSMVQVAQAGPA
jgi:hypothetical protein